MTFETYVERQKSIIRERHVGDEYYIIGGQVIPAKSREQILRELENMKGLNKKERTAYPTRRVQRA